MATILVACGTSGEGPVVRVAIPRGATVSAIADTLDARGIIDSPRLFRLRVRLGGRDRALQAGVYDLRAPMPMGELIELLARGRTASDRLSIPEGLMLSEIATIIEQRLGIPADSVVEAARTQRLIDRVGARGPTLEGYVFPTTYQVRVGASAVEVVTQMIDAFEAQWQPAWDARLDSLGLTRDELITLASIIEGEVRHDVDRKYVSSVYHNRLRRGMRLQADPTVIYAIGVRRRLFERDYDYSSPFNTYQISGLPPHPIGQASTASIEAALYPHQSDFLYFVAGPNGKHIFTRSYREHLATIRQVRSGTSRIPN